MLKWHTAGESHGKALVAMLEGVPSGVQVTTEMIIDALAERRLGHGRGARQKFEQDEVEILAGVRHGRTTGGPVAIVIGNSEWPKWEQVMSADPVPWEALVVDAGKGDPREMGRNKTLRRPRPGHADLAGMLSYRLEDARDVLERASARETAARVALGAIAKQILKEAAGVTIVGHVRSVGPAENSDDVVPTPDDLPALRASEVRTLNPAAEQEFIEMINGVKKSGNTVGGVAEVVAWGVPLGLGSHTEMDRKLDARLAAALMSIQSAKSVEIGAGRDAGATLGSDAHDEISLRGNEVVRLSNLAGGIEGGTSNGQPIVARVGFKPISTVPRALSTVDLDTGEEVTAFHQRSDTSQIVPAAVIAEAMVALTLAQALLERFGGNSIQEVAEMQKNQEDYVATRLSFEDGAR